MKDSYYWLALIHYNMAKLAMSYCIAIKNLPFRQKMSEDLIELSTLSLDSAKELLKYHKMGFE